MIKKQTKKQTKKQPQKIKISALQKIVNELSKRIDVYYSSRQAKKDYLKNLEIYPNIWIDDCPEWIIRNG